MAPARTFSQGLPRPQPSARALRSARPSGFVLAAAGAFLAALAAPVAAAAEPLTGGRQAMVEERQATLVAAPSTVAPGEVVTLEGSGFPAGASLEVGAGPPYSQYEVLDWTTADDTGRASHEVLVPWRAEPGQAVVFVMATEDFRVKGVSNVVVIEGGAAPAVALAR